MKYRKTVRMIYQKNGKLNIGGGLLLISYELADLDNKGNMRILLTLLNEDKKLTDLLKIEGIGHGTLYKNIEILTRLGLIEEYRDTYSSRFFKLTDKGRRIAELVRKIQEELVKGEEN